MGGFELLETLAVTPVRNLAASTALSFTCQVIPALTPVTSYLLSACSGSAHHHACFLAECVSAVRYAERE